MLSHKRLRRSEPRCGFQPCARHLQVGSCAVVASQHAAHADALSQVVCSRGEGSIGYSRVHGRRAGAPALMGDAGAGVT